jgi:hypothetical protein
VKVSTLDHSVLDLLRFIGTIQYKNQGEWWRSIQARVVKDDDTSENNVDFKVIDVHICQHAAMSAKDSRLLIGEMANIYAKDGIVKC